MYGGNDFDGGAAAFMGGGFMPSQATQAPDPNFSSSSSSNKNRDARSLFPLTVKQIRELASNDESNFIIDGAEVNNVRVVGRVCHKEDKASEYSVLIDDGTGQIECTRWVQESLDAEEMGAIAIGTYVCVHGHLRGLQGRRFINVFSIRPVTDFNEIPSHFIECIYVHFYNTRLRGANAQPSTGNTMSTPSKGYQAAPANQSYGYSTLDGINNVGIFAKFHVHVISAFPCWSLFETFIKPALLDVNDTSQGFAHLHHIVFNLCSGSEDGAHRNAMARELNIPMTKLMSVSLTLLFMCLFERSFFCFDTRVFAFGREELQTLVDNGFIYSTIDDDHFKSTVNA
ncbi:hypothetical protein Tsubulata_005030 [Turnera subulata]|uniref:OB domain-containing protein n=1 Tax=Turnera subulata TaxID=218843 RepID=A0A9Q0FCC8_9ROSI|nr:hypothetical protein Tsubulata_005030 [Turnera subulata]